MRRIALVLSIALAIAIPASVSPNPLASAEGNPPVTTTAPHPPTIRPPVTTTTTMLAKDDPCNMPSEEVSSNCQYTPPAEIIKTIEVTGWGTKVINEGQSLSLQARDTEPGDQPETVQVNFDLCALKDTAISDQDSMGSGDITVDSIKFPEDGLLDGKRGEDDYSEDYSSPRVIIVDNTPMVNKILNDNSVPGDPVYGEAGDLVSVLRKGTCTTASVEVKRTDRDKLAFGFVYWTIPFGEFRVGGGVTQLAEQGPTTVRYFFEIN